jgi:hypothetical protein
MPPGTTIVVALGGLLLVGWVVAALWPWLVAMMVAVGVSMALGRRTREG